MELKIMTFNLRCDCTNDGINQWKNRTELVKRTILEETPDIIGFQEVMRHMAGDVAEMISDEYFIVGVGRDRNYNGEGVSIAYKKTKFDLLHLETFWLSDTPNVPGSRYEKLDQSGCPRITVIAGLVPRGKGKTVYFCNTHLDHEGEKARLEGARLIIERLGALCDENSTVIITGDMNALPNSAVVPVFCDSTFGICDITENVGETFHDFGRKIGKDIKIDYIFTNAQKTNKPSYTAKQYTEDGVFCSDHYPVCGFVEI